mmetsp:Transcript_70955/g.200280  ORF Transcript_70955/g.200280 Transcript_70955/m.200280 type:complete len:818 (+) Transcript_70955:115-2568(+)
MEDPGAAAPPPPDGHAYEPGDPVKYWSETLGKWIVAAVARRNPDGSYDLDRKAHVEPERIRPHGGKSARQDAAALEEEMRVDPTDGQPRNFLELKRLCAGDYTEEQVVEYWQTKCVPYARARFEGSWMHGKRKNVIRGTRLEWQIGRTTYIETTSPTSFSMELDGDTYRACLEPGDRVLTWSDGDTWTRAQDDPATGKAAAQRQQEREPKPAGGECAGPGDQVKYWSGSASRWVVATVLRRHPDGSYELDKKKCAKAEHVRLARRGTPGPELARWQMQLPRALAEASRGDDKQLTAMFRARVDSHPQAQQAREYRYALADAIEAAKSMGLDVRELEAELAGQKQKVKSRRGGGADAAGRGDPDGDAGAFDESADAPDARSDGEGAQRAADFDDDANAAFLNAIDQHDADAVWEGLKKARACGGDALMEDLVSGLDMDGNTLLHRCVSAPSRSTRDASKGSENRGDTTTSLLLRARADVNAPNLMGEAPLLSAARSFHFAPFHVEHTLLAARADPNLANLSTGTSPLMEAASRGNAALCRLLVEAAADPLRQNQRGLTAADLAGHAEHDSVVVMLGMLSSEKGRRQPEAGQQSGAEQHGGAPGSGKPPSTTPMPSFAPPPRAGAPGAAAPPGGPEEAQAPGAPPTQSGERDADPDPLGMLGGPDAAFLRGEVDRWEAMTVEALQAECKSQSLQAPEGLGKRGLVLRLRQVGAWRRLGLQALRAEWRRCWGRRGVLGTRPPPKVRLVSEAECEKEGAREGHDIVRRDLAEALISSAWDRIEALNESARPPRAPSAGKAAHDGPDAGYSYDGGFLRVWQP